MQHAQMFKQAHDAEGIGHEQLCIQDPDHVPSGSLPADLVNCDESLQGEVQAQKIVSASKQLPLRYLKPRSGVSIFNDAEVGGCYIMLVFTVADWRCSALSANIRIWSGHGWGWRSGRSLSTVY